MKKIIFFAITVTLAFSSCLKPSEVYNGASKKQFSYTPSGLRPTMIGVPLNGIATIGVNGKLLQLQCLTQFQSGDAIMVDPPMVPGEWNWLVSAQQYQPVSAVYNVAAGFSHQYAKAYFVELFPNGSWRFWNGVSVGWDNTPNGASLLGLFEYPRTWVNPVTLPLMGKVTKSTNNGVSYGLSM